MKLSNLGIGFLGLSLTLASLTQGCGSSDSPPAGGTGGTTGTGGGGGTSGTVTYADVKPIFMAKCTPCHTTGGSAAIFHTLASSSETATAASLSCPSKTKGACTIVRIKDGTMPSGKGCKNDGTDVNPACLTKAEVDKVAVWAMGVIKP